MICLWSHHHGLWAQPCSSVLHQYLLLQCKLRTATCIIQAEQATFVRFLWKLASGLCSVCREYSPSVDIVFVHGLLGSVFKTWRQHDSQNVSRLAKLESMLEPKVSPVRSSACKIAVDPSSPRAKEMQQHYTKSWPKSWLSKDLPNTRILALDYDTYLSQWVPNCPLEPDKRTLLSRATEMLAKLHQAGVGDRPIIWIAHSMGGLLVKQMVTLASDSAKYRSIAENTAGVVFYAVPHRGADLADLNATFKLLLLPSVEVQELRKGLFLWCHLVCLAHCHYSKRVARVCQTSSGLGAYPCHKDAKNGINSFLTTPMDKLRWPEGVAIDCMTALQCPRRGK